jgi:hypothetical protein
MYTKPRGLLPNITALVGFLIPAGAIILYLPTAHTVIGPGASSFLDKTAGLVFTLIFLFFPFFFGIFFSSLFPEIKLTQHGIAYRYWQFLGGTVKWEEIEFAIVKNDRIILGISRRGIPLFNGLYFYALHGMIFRLGLPVLLVATDAESRQELLQMLEQNSPCTIKKR